MDEVRQRRRTSEAQSIKAPFASSSVIPDELYKGYVFDLDGTIYLGAVCRHDTRAHKQNGRG